MSNLNFFKSCLSNELNGTLQLFQSLPNDKLDYTPHPVNRSAKQLIEHILAHMVDMKIIAENNVCDETLTYDFLGTADASEKLTHLWKILAATLGNISDEGWDNEPIDLTIEGKPFITLPRNNMMWFFFFDVIHHRGQLSSYVRPMGGKNPAIYGYSADTL